MKANFQRVTSGSCCKLSGFFLTDKMSTFANGICLLEAVFSHLCTAFLQTWGVFLWQDLDQYQWSKITRIMVHQTNRWIRPWPEWIHPFFSAPRISDHFSSCSDFTARIIVERTAGEIIASPNVTSRWPEVYYTYYYGLFCVDSLLFSSINKIVV